MRTTLSSPIVIISVLTVIFVITVSLQVYPSQVPSGTSHQSQKSSPLSSPTYEQLDTPEELAYLQEEPSMPEDPQSQPAEAPAAIPTAENICQEGCGGYKCLQKLDNHNFDNWGGLCTGNLWGQVYPLNGEPISSEMMTGPRVNPVTRRRALVVIICGETGKKRIPTLVEKFGVHEYRFMLLHYDMSDWSQFPWYEHVISIRFPGQMKWWYVKRFVTPEMAESYDYIAVFDDDVGVANMDLGGYLDILTEYNISLSQPSLDLTSTRRTWPVTMQQKANSIGRWVDFVECGPATFFSRAMYQKCVYDLLREDLASGWGYDVFWHKFCHTVYGFNRSAVIDRYTIFHDGGLAATATASQSKGPGVVRYRPNIEYDAIVVAMDKLGHFRAALEQLRVITENDRVVVLPPRQPPT